ncbi:hypothetical protein F4678DRAFT_416225 [Xylaria arbuscula]|nr:hypothetical protein F4678DRAFT_416225 [Xylaria arbuscula]
MSVKAIGPEPMEGSDVQSAKSETAKPEGMADSEDVFHLFGKLPVELQDIIWEFAIPSEIFNFTHLQDNRTPAPYPRMPAIASVCRGSREITLRYGVWLITEGCKTPMFFIPDSSVLHGCHYQQASKELIVTANQVITGFDSILMRMAVRFHTLDLVRHIIILVSDGETGKIPATWPKSSDGRPMAEVELDPPITFEPAQWRRAEEAVYYPRAEWTAKRWEEIEIAAKRAWLLARWYVRDPVGVRREDILDPSRWSRLGPDHWIRRTLLSTPSLHAGHMRSYSHMEA